MGGKTLNMFIYNLSTCRIGEAGIVLVRKYRK